MYHFADFAILCIALNRKVFRQNDCYTSFSVELAGWAACYSNLLFWFDWKWIAITMFYSTNETAVTSSQLNPNTPNIWRITRRRKKQQPYVTTGSINYSIVYLTMACVSFIIKDEFYARWIRHTIRPNDRLQQKHYVRLCFDHMNDSFQEHFFECWIQC